MVKAKSNIKAPATNGPISIQLLSEARVLELHRALVIFSAAFLVTSSEDVGKAGARFFVAVT